MTKSPSKEITASSIIQADRESIASEMQDEVAILDPRSGMYFGLDQVGSTIWKLIQQPIRVKDIQDAIMEEYDVARNQCEKDLYFVLKEMSDHRLVVIQDECNA